jgi:hypothetical protein
MVFGIRDRNKYSFVKTVLKLGFQIILSTLACMTSVLLLVILLAFVNKWLSPLIN